MNAWTLNWVWIKSSACCAKCTTFGGSFLPNVGNPPPQNFWPGLMPANKVKSIPDQLDSSQPKSAANLPMSGGTRHMPSMRPAWTRANKILSKLWLIIARKIQTQYFHNTSEVINKKICYGRGTARRACQYRKACNRRMNLTYTQGHRSCCYKMAIRHITSCLFVDCCFNVFI